MSELVATAPRISVVVPAYNEERYVGATLESVKTAIAEYRRAHDAEVEMVVVDNNSSDRTGEVARAHGARVVFEPRNNISTARNAGARAARGEILVFLDADDHLSPNFLALVDDAMRSGQYAGGGARIVWNKRSAWVSAFNAFGNGIRWLFGVSNAVPFTSRETFEAVGGFDERYYAGEDMKFASEVRRWGRAQGKRFRVITDGYVLKSARKFDLYGGVVVVLGLLAFALGPWLVRSKRACFFWYAPRR
ncbi:MAG: glycosyltransferase [Candidatus Rokubacteria bacterium]|nr:glycosyltransferase [Candidatus Rokubacteria bacterium]